MYIYQHIYIYIHIYICVIFSLIFLYFPIYVCYIFLSVAMQMLWTCAALGPGSLWQHTNQRQISACRYPASLAVDTP